MTRDDWLLGEQREASARDRLYREAEQLIAEEGIDHFTMSRLASRAYCSRATVYRHVGSRGQVVDELLRRSSESIVAKIHTEVDDLEGSERATAAIRSALRLIDSNPIASAFFASVHAVQNSRAVVSSPVVLGVATELLGIPGDESLARVLVRTIIGMHLWPIPEGEKEEDPALELIGLLVKGSVWRDS